MNASGTKIVLATSSNGSAVLNPSHGYFVPLVPLNGTTHESLSGATTVSSTHLRSVDVFPPSFLPSADAKDLNKQQKNQVANRMGSEKEKHAASVASPLFQPLQSQPNESVRFFPSDSDLSRDFKDKKGSQALSLAQQSAANEKNSNIFSAELSRRATSSAAQGTPGTSAAAAVIINHSDLYAEKNINGYVLLNVTDAFLTDIGIQSASARTFILISVDEIKGIAPITYPRQAPNVDAPPQYF
ncbi:hypothetical protein HDU67_002744 [Dinochytrium kinnereticum]|nr:hypothetical protein HDU67_002744 [Dinochytrium kinnereticum]